MNVTRDADDPVYRPCFHFHGARPNLEDRDNEGQAAQEQHPARLQKSFGHPQRGSEKVRTRMRSSGDLRLIVELEATGVKLRACGRTAAALTLERFQAVA
jgi:hypothetical protein